MKKIYQNPTTTVENFELESMIAASELLFKQELDDSGVDANDALSRRNVNVWGDDEE